MPLCEQMGGTLLGIPCVRSLLFVCTSFFAIQAC